MERIEPIMPSPPAIPPVDTTGVKVRAPRRDEEGARERRRREAAKRRAGAAAGASPEDDAEAGAEDAGERTEPPAHGRIDVQA